MNRSIFHFLFLTICFYFSSHCISQSITYEPLGKVPLVEVEKVYVAPYGGVFLQSRSKLSRSNDNGQTWSEVENLPSQFKSYDIVFLQDGTAILIDPIYEDKALIFRDGAWQDLMGDLSVLDVNSQPYAVYNNTFFFQKSDTLYKTNDKGLSYAKKRIFLEGRPIKMMADASLIYIFKGIRDTITNRDAFLIDTYDHHFNFVERNFIQNELGFISSGYSINNFGANILILSPLEDKILLTVDAGATILERSFNDVRPQEWGLAQNKIFFQEDGQLLSLPLTNDFSTAAPLVEENESDFRFFNIQNDHSVNINRFEFATQNLNTGFKNTFSEFSFSDVFLSDLKINRNGGIFTSTIWDGRIYKSIDDGQSWDRMPGSGFYHLNDNGSYVTFLAGESDTNIGTVSGQGQVIEEWEINDTLIPPGGLGGREGFTVNNGEYRFIVANRNCQNQLWNLFVSKDYGPFERFEISPLACTPVSPELVVFNDKLYLTSPYSFGVYTTIDLNNNYEVERKNLTSSPVQTTVHTARIKKNGEVYVYSYDGSAGDGNVDFGPTYYSDDVRNDFVEVGQGPRGLLLANDLIEGSFIINKDARHFYRNNVSDDYTEIPVENNSLTAFRTGDIDNKGRIIALAWDGVYRTNQLILSSVDKKEFSSTIKVYPNPVQDILQIEFNNHLEGSFNILDIQGRLIKTSEFSNTNLQIEIPEIDNGIYLLEIIERDGNRFNQKFIKI